MTPNVSSEFRFASERKIADARERYSAYFFHLIAVGAGKTSRAVAFRSDLWPGTRMIFKISETESRSDVRLKRGREG